MSKTKELTTVGELVDALKDVPRDRQICVSCWDGALSVSIIDDPTSPWIMFV